MAIVIMIELWAEGITGFLSNCVEAFDVLLRFLAILARLSAPVVLFPSKVLAWIRDPFEDESPPVRVAIILPGENLSRCCPSSRHSKHSPLASRQGLRGVRSPATRVPQSPSPSVVALCVLCVQVPVPFFLFRSSLPRCSITLFHHAINLSTPFFHVALNGWYPGS